MIDINFEFWKEIPKGKDPDSCSPTLQSYHKILWSKPLPNGKNFELLANSTKSKRRLFHNSKLGEFVLSSDSIGHTYRSVKIKSIKKIVDQIDTEKINSFYSVCCTIGGYILFPAKEIDNKRTINCHRGMHSKLKDRWDLSLECIRCFYNKKESPIKETLIRYSDFFNLFENFEGYVKHFHLQDMVSEDYNSIKFFLPFKGFNHPPLPANVDEYLTYRENLMTFIKARNKRIYKSC